MTNMPIGETAICHYPQGGTAKSTGGRGIFRDAAGEQIRIWVDYMLKSGRSIIKAAQSEDDVNSDTSIASAYHDAPETQLLILHPSSHHIFDSYCHPAWLTASRRRKYDKYREEHGDEEEEWTRKVLLKDQWLWRCIEAGRFLGESDGWAGCRVGGPPKGQILDVRMDVDTITLNNGVKRQLSAEETGVDEGMDMELDELEEEEDVKPTFNSGPVSISTPMDIQVEPPTPSQSLDVDVQLHTTAPMQPDVRPEMIGPAVKPDEEDLLFEEPEPSPPPVRRSSRRSQSTARFVQVKDELESSDEEPLSAKAPPPTNGRRSRPPSIRISKQSTTTSLIGLDDIDISILDSGPSSRFQSPPPRPPVVEGKIFSGLVFWVDLSMKNRGDLLKEIKTAGGKIAADHGDATHVLIYKFAQQAGQWKEIISTLAPKGTWFLSPEWAKKSLAEKERLPEIDHCVPGGTLAGSASAVGAAETGGPQRKDDAVNSSDNMTEFLNKSFKALKASGLSDQEVAESMHSRSASVSVEKWKVLYEAWTQRTGLFSHLPPLSTPKSSAFAPLQESTLQVKTERPSQVQFKARLNKPEIEAIFAKESWRFYRVYSEHLGKFGKFLEDKYGVYTQRSWAAYYGEWNNGRGRWVAVPRILQGKSLTVEELREGPVAEVTTPRTDVAPLPGQTPSLPKHEIASALCTYFKHSGENIVINASLGEHMEALYPACSGQIWEKVARDWERGSDMFAGLGPRWEGGSSAGENLSNSEQPREETNKPLHPLPPQPRYTEDEELSMGQFVMHQASIGQPVSGSSSGSSWATFAEVYPHRSKMAWSAHYRRGKDRIMDIARRHAATQEANQPDPEDLDPTYSDRSPSPIASGSQPKQKKQKVAVSKKDYEDLARFIVNNIAEGDVPDTKDFAKFSQDHPERSGSSWYTIWHRDKYRSTLLPLIDESRRAAAPRSQSCQGRVARTGSRPHPNAYTDEEERQMAEFIVRHVPSDRPPKVADWNKFARSHTKRTAPSWMEHYRVYKPRIDGLAGELKAANPSIARHPAGTAQDAIELGSEEEEEEEVEEIVPIRPPRSRSRRSDVIIIED